MGLLVGVVQLAGHPFVSQSVVCCLFGGSHVRKVGLPGSRAVSGFVSCSIRQSVGPLFVRPLICRFVVKSAVLSVSWLVGLSFGCSTSVGRSAGRLADQSEGQFVS